MPSAAISNVVACKTRIAANGSAGSVTWLLSWLTV
jgi:hypothetical protein